MEQELSNCPSADRTFLSSTFPNTCSLAVTQETLLSNQMTGILAQIIALTAYGNDYLKNGIVPLDFDNANSTFQFCNKVDFRELEKTFFFSKPKERVIADNPTNWYEILKNDDCKYLRLYFENSKDLSIGKDHKLAGLVGGGGKWLIEAVYDTYSNYWSNRWEVTNRNASDNKIWSVNYGVTAKKKIISNLQLDNEMIKNQLRKTLLEIADFAFKQNLQGWGEQFDKANATLDSLSPEDNYYHKDLIPLDNYQLVTKQILFAAGTAWVFGAMGSWNDLGFNTDEDNNTYDRLSEQLYSNINQAIIAATNTF